MKIVRKQAFSSSCAKIKWPIPGRKLRFILKRGLSRTNNIVQFERLVDLGKPCCAGRGATAAALVEGQLQLPQHSNHLLARAHMTHARSRSKRRLIQIVEGCEAARKKLT